METRYSNRGEGAVGDVHCCGVPHKMCSKVATGKCTPPRACKIVTHTTDNVWEQASVEVIGLKVKAQQGGAQLPLAHGCTYTGTLRLQLH